jgi:hypothetical protein
MSKARDLADLAKNANDRLDIVATSDGALSNRSLIINGAMQVWQRGLSGFGHNAFSADRWREDTNTDDGLAVGFVEVPSSGEAGLPRQFTYMAKFALTAGTTVGVNDLRQKVENPKGLAGQTLTLSYYIKASSSCTINNRRIGWNGVTNAPPTTNLPSLNVTTGWQRVENTFTLGSSGTAVYASNANLDVILGLPINTTVDVYITGVQLERGDTATPFEHRSYGQELALCQRFFQNGIFAYEGVEDDGELSGVCYYKQTMRAAPTLSSVNSGGTSAAFSGLSDKGAAQCQWWLDTGGITTFVEKYITADAEL